MAYPLSVASEPFTEDRPIYVSSSPRTEISPHSVGIFLNPEIEVSRFIMVQVSHGSLFFYRQSSLMLRAVYKNAFLIHLFPALYILVMS